MKSIQVLLVVAAAAVFIPAPSHQQAQQSNKCMEDFGNAWSACLKQAGLPVEQAMWFVTNGTSPRGQAPPNPDAFKTQICSAQPQVGACTFQSVGPIMNSSACVGTSPSTSQQAALNNQLNSIFGTYDLKCMHPCRTSLPDDLRMCYTDNKLDASLFLSNSSNGAVIGSTQEQVTAFCGAKDALVKCLQGKVDACPDAQAILRAIDLDISSFQKGVTVLCNHPDVYLHGLKCFAETTPDIDRCKQKDTQSLIQLDTQARAGNWSQERTAKEMCQNTLNSIACDLDAWGKKIDPACTPAVMGLRRELECELMNGGCNVDPKQINQADHVCHPEKFGTQARNDFSKGSPSNSAWVKAGSILTGLALMTSTVTSTVM